MNPISSISCHESYYIPVRSLPVERTKAFTFLAEGVHERKCPTKKRNDIEPLWNARVFFFYFLHFPVKTNFFFYKIPIPFYPVPVKSHVASLGIQILRACLDPKIFGEKFL
jgi:hypothetical protein